MHRALLALVSLYLAGMGAYEVARSGALGGEAKVRCWGEDEAPAEPFVQRVLVDACHPHLGEMMYLRRGGEVVGVLVPLRSSADASEPISMLLQVLEPELVKDIVADDVPLDGKEWSVLSGPTYSGHLLPRDKVSEGRRARLLERYEDLDGGFRVLALDARPDWTDGGVMLFFAMLGAIGWWRVRPAES